MCETPDCWDVLADKMIGWMDPVNAPADRTHIAEKYHNVAQFLRDVLPASHERQVAIRKLLESYTWAVRISLGHGLHSIQTYYNQLTSISWWLNESQGKSPLAIANHFWGIHYMLTLKFDKDGPVTFERVQAAQLLLESRDAAVRACLEMLAEQQKQELRVVSQST